MSAIVTDLSPDALTAAIEANTIAYYRHYRHYGPTELHDDPALLWFTTGLPSPELNGVLRAMLSDPDQEIAALLAQFARRGLPLTWHIGPSSRPARLGERLLAHGLRHLEDEPGMAADLHALRESLTPPAGLEIRPVLDAAGLRVWLRVWAYDLAEAALEPYVRLYSSLGLGPSHPLQHLLGLRDGVPVATAAVFYGAGVASVQHVVTLPAQRRQGIGAALTLDVMRRAQAAGYRVAVLSASPQGQRVYERLGFRSSCMFSRYVWSPGG